MTERLTVVQLVRVAVNDHFAQTGIPIIAGEDLVDFLEDVMYGHYTDQEIALMQTICSGGVLRAGPVDMVV